MLDIYVDADGCPVKDEIYRVAARYNLNVILVANARMRIPDRDSIRLVVVGQDFDAADDWIVDHIAENDIAVTDDIPLAARCLKIKARALSPRGRVFTDGNIGGALATRDFLAHLRELGTMSGGPAPFAKQDRSQFLQRLDEIIQAIQRV